MSVPLSLEQVANLIQLAGTPQKKCLILVGVYFGLRISEILALQLHHMYTRNIQGKYVLREYIDVICLKKRKKNEIRQMIVPDDFKRHWNKYFDVDASLNAGEPYWVFPSNYGKKGKPVTRQTAHNWLKALYKSLGIQGATHNLRVTFATQLSEQGVQVPEIQQLLNHSNPATTMRYTRVSDRTIKAAMNKIKLKK